MAFSFTPTQSGSLVTTLQRTQPPWLDAMHQQGAGAAQNYFQNYQSNPATVAGLNSMNQVAQNPNQYGYGNVLNEFNKTARGDYLYGGPGMDAYMQAASRQIQPAVQSAFARSGRTNSGLAPVAMTQAMSDSYAGLYDSERGRQMSALNMAPQMAQFAQTPGQQQYQVGQFADNEPESNLDDYLRRLQAPGELYASESTEQPLFENDLNSLLGSLALGSSALFGNGGGGLFGNDGGGGGGLLGALTSLFGGGGPQIPNSDLFNGLGDIFAGADDGSYTGGVPGDQSGAPVDWADALGSAFDPAGTSGIDWAAALNPGTGGLGGLLGGLLTSDPGGFVGTTPTGTGGIDFNAALAPGQYDLDALPRQNMSALGDVMTLQEFVTDPQLVGQLTDSEQQAMRMALYGNNGVATPEVTAAMNRLGINTGSLGDARAALNPQEVAAAAEAAEAARVAEAATPATTFPYTSPYTAAGDPNADLILPEFDPQQTTSINGDTGGPGAGAVGGGGAAAVTASQLAPGGGSGLPTPPTPPGALNQVQEWLSEALGLGGPEFFGPGALDALPQITNALGPELSALADLSGVGNIGLAGLGSLAGNPFTSAGLSGFGSGLSSGASAGVSGASPFFAGEGIGAGLNSALPVGAFGETAAATQAAPAFGSTLSSLATPAAIAGAMYGINSIQAGAKAAPISGFRDDLGAAAMSGAPVQLVDGSSVSVIPDFADRTGNGFLVAGRNDGARVEPRQDGLHLVVPGQGSSAQHQASINQYLEAMLARQNSGNEGGGGLLQAQPYFNPGGMVGDAGEPVGVTTDPNILMSAALAGLLPLDPWGNSDGGA